MYELIEDLYFLKARPSRRDANWYLSAGNHKAIITSLRFGLPIILKMTGKILDDLKMTQDQMNKISRECNELRDQFESKLRSSNEELDRRLTLLQDKIYHQNQNSELSLLKSRATRTQAIELQSFLKSIAPFLPTELSHQCAYLCTRPIPTFNDTVQWALSTIPNSPKIPLTKYTICEPGNLLSPLWEDFSEVNLTAQDLELPQSQLFTPRERSIVTFYENQIKEMQNLKIIGSPHPQNPLSLHWDIGRA